MKLGQGIAAVIFSWSSMHFTAACMNVDGGPEKTTGAANSPLEAPGPPAAHTGDPIVVEPPPTLEPRDEEAAAWLLADEAGRGAELDDPVARVAAFRARAFFPTSLLKVEFVSDDGPTPVGRQSTWTVHAVLAGADVPASITLVQRAEDDGELPGCVSAEGRPGRIDVMIVENVATSYRLIQDTRGTMSFAIGTSVGKYQWHMGPALAEADVLAVAEVW